MQVVAISWTVARMAATVDRQTIMMEMIMRFSCVIAIIVLGFGLVSSQQPTAHAQPYQTGWVGPAQRGVLHPQRQPNAGCQHHSCPSCQTPYEPCQPPCEPYGPKGGEPPKKKGGQPTPRAGVPGIAPGVFVAPPQSGVIEGPSRGFEIGNISLTLPEISLGLPRLRCEGIKRLSRDTRMMTDRAASPYVANPYYATAYAQQQAQASKRSADVAEDDDTSGTRGGTPGSGSVQKDGGPESNTKGALPADLEARIRHLEGCFEQQVKALQACVEELKALRSSGAGQQNTTTCAPTFREFDLNNIPSEMRFRSPRPLPPTIQTASGGQATRANYEVVTPAGGTVRTKPPQRWPAVRY